MTSIWLKVLSKILVVARLVEPGPLIAIVVLIKE